MSLIYKFRNMKSFLEYKELEDHYFYFSKIDKLNDPWEGNLSLGWNTDESDNWKDFYLTIFASFIWFYVKEIHNQENLSKTF